MDDSGSVDRFTDAQDAAALDALIDSGFEPDAVPAGQRERAGRAACLLGLLDRGPAFGGRRLRIERVLAEEGLRTPDLGGPADTKTCGAAIADAVAEGI